MDFNPIDILNNSVNKAGDLVRDSIGLGRTKSTSTEASHFSVEGFKSEVLNRGLAEEDRFEVMIMSPRCLAGQANSTELASILCETVQFPHLSLFVKQLRIFGPAHQRPLMSDYGGDGLNMTFLMDRDMQVKMMFDRWIQSIVNQDTYMLSYPDEYTTTIYIRQLDRSDHVIYTCVIEDAFPKVMAGMNLNQSARGQFHRLNVQFAYRKWKVLGTSTLTENASQSQRNFMADQIDRHKKDMAAVSDKYGLDISVSPIVI